MRTRTRVATALAAGALATALLASPSIAANAQSGSAAGQGAGASFRTAEPLADCDGTARAGAGRQAAGDRGAGGQGMGRQGTGAPGAGRQGAGALADLTGVATGTLTDDQKVALANMAEEEKLAHDLYVALSGAVDDPKFDRIASAETQHLAQVRLVLDRYDIADPTAGQAAGTFATESVQSLYDDQLAAGSVSLDAALEVGIWVEMTDIADLTTATVGVTAPDVLQVYSNLLAGSQRHLVAFGG